MIKARQVLGPVEISGEIDFQSCQIGQKTLFVSSDPKKPVITIKPGSKISLTDFEIEGAMGIELDNAELTLKNTDFKISGN